MKGMFDGGYGKEVWFSEINLILPSTRAVYASEPTLSDYLPFLRLPNPSSIWWSALRNQMQVSVLAVLCPSEDALQCCPLLSVSLSPCLDYCKPLHLL